MSLQINFSAGVRPMLTSYRLCMNQQLQQLSRQVVLLLMCLIAASGCKMGSVGQALSGVPSQSEPPVKSYDQPVVEKSGPAKDRLAKALEEDTQEDGFGFE